jgi:hypothetical protein
MHHKDLHLTQHKCSGVQLLLHLSSWIASAGCATGAALMLMLRCVLRRCRFVMQEASPVCMDCFCWLRHQRCPDVGAMLCAVRVAAL